MLWKHVNIFLRNENNTQLLFSIFFNLHLFLNSTYNRLNIGNFTQLFCRRYWLCGQGGQRQIRNNLHLTRLSLHSGHHCLIFLLEIIIFGEMLMRFGNFIFKRIYFKNVFNAFETTINSSLNKGLIANTYIYLKLRSKFISS